MKAGIEKMPDGSNREFLLSGSRDKSLIIWDLHDVSDADGTKEHGKPRKVLTGHSHFISDIDLSSDSRFALSSSWDGTIRLWNLAAAETGKTLFGHTKDVMTVAFSPDNRQIASGSIDKQIKIWNITTMSLMHTFVGHKAQVNCLDIASGTTFLASGGRDGKVNVWNLVDGKHLDECDAESPVNCVIFASRVLWVIIGTEEGIRVYHLPSKKFIDKFTADDLDGKQRRSAKIGCTSLCFSKDNHNTLYAGFTDGYVRVLNITPVSQ